MGPIQLLIQHLTRLVFIGEFVAKRCFGNALATWCVIGLIPDITGRGVKERRIEASSSNS
jgi:hypothetical protein